MIVLGIESSCDETGLALFDSKKGLLAHTLHSQIAVHAEYGDVVPELASRDHIRYLVPLLEQVLQQACVSKADLDDKFIAFCSQCSFVFQSHFAVLMTTIIIRIIHYKM